MTFNRTYLYGDLSDPPLTNLSTVPIPPGSSAVIEFSVPYPGNHSLEDSRLVNSLEKGAFAQFIVTDPPSASRVGATPSPALASGRIVPLDRPLADPLSFAAARWVASGDPALSPREGLLRFQSP
jgi:hypothetical protein